MHSRVDEEVWLTTDCLVQAHHPNCYAQPSSPWQSDSQLFKTLISSQTRLHSSLSLSLGELSHMVAWGYIVPHLKITTGFLSPRQDLVHHVLYIYSCTYIYHLSIGSKALEVILTGNFTELNTKWHPQSHMSDIFSYWNHGILKFINAVKFHVLSSDTGPMNLLYLTMSHSWIPFVRDTCSCAVFRKQT